jgi:hypothetical protein
MIPAFDDNGYLPSGIHPATLDEIAARFGQQSELRRVQMESLRWMAEIALRAGVVRLIVNGSFVTDIIEPNDVDCVLLIRAGFPAEKSTEAELLAGLPFLEINLVNEVDFATLVDQFFCDGSTASTQRDGGDHTMSLQNQRELNVTREKLRLLEARYQASQLEVGGDIHVRELSQMSLKRLINQLKEEIARFESRLSCQ